jgi:hypothetical protein
MLLTATAMDDIPESFYKYEWQTGVSITVLKTQKRPDRRHKA